MTTQGSPTPQPPRDGLTADEYDTEEHLPRSHWPLPELSEVEHAQHAPTTTEYEKVQASERFIELRARFRRFAFPMTAAFLAWYFLFVLLSVFARDFMATPVWGNLNLGMIMGLLQFVTTFLITWLYIRHASKNLDPIAAELRAELEEATE